jgi:hypothetical protein
MKGKRRGQGPAPVTERDDDPLALEDIIRAARDIGPARRRVAIAGRQIPTSFSTTPNMVPTGAA